MYSDSPMLPKNLTFVDVETTGLNAQFGRIIEIGILRVEDNQVVEEFTSLINPLTHLDPFIQTMTGITPQELEDAPTFYEVKDDIKRLLQDSIFVAHSVMFDYGFLKHEFKRHEQSFNPKYFCSVKLAKQLFPRFKKHNLDSIIDRFDFKCKRRHRAFDDAKVLWDLYSYALKNLGEEKVEKAIAKIMKRPSLPISISEQVINSLPEKPGVYIFKNADSAPLYIGKSKNIRDRILSHFSASKDSSLEMKIAENTKTIDTITTAGELTALLLESKLVKQQQPLYNRKLRNAMKLFALKKVETNDYFSVDIQILQEVPVEELENVMGIFKSQKQLKDHLHDLAKDHKLCLKLLGLEKGKGSCFYYHLGICDGACVKKEKVLKYNLRFDEAFYKTKIKRWPFAGPVGVKEDSDQEEIIVIDKWCILGHLKNGDTFEDLSKEYLFDTDTYKILASFLTKQKHIKIFPMSH